MCGITGWVDLEKDLSNQYPTIKKMTETLTHRGPDDSGTWLSEHVAFGHKRLSVIDPVGGKQPMIRRRGDQTFVISYNGELYNTAELRQELESRGYTFETTSDTEVLLVAFMEWNTECVHRLNGIFAFAVWVEPDQYLFISRDRLGVKPLFYTQQGSSFIFGSELKSLLAFPEVKPEIDNEGLAEIFVLGPGRTPGHGVFRNVQELKPGHSLVFKQNKVHIEQYWSLKSMPHQDDLETTTQKVKELLQDAVTRQLVSDVPICTLLSGGVDSSAITAFATQEYERTGQGQVHTYSIDYVDNDIYFQNSTYQPNSDSAWVDYVARLLDTKHHSVTIEIPQLAESLYEAVRARDLPGMADIDSSLYLFCKAIKKNATVALSGECADEIFGGYPWFNNREMINSNTFPWSNALQERMKLLKPELVDYIKPEEYRERRYRETLEEVPHLPGESSHEARLREISYLSLKWFMATLLDRKDRMSMYTGLEVRVPFCDHRLVEYVWNIPWWMKKWNREEKGILRRALEGIIPDDVLHRKKSPYPKTHNPAYREAVQKTFEEIVHDPASPLVPLLNKKKIKELLQLKEDAFNRPWYGQLMSGPQLFAYLIQIDTWLREYNVSIK